MVDSCVDGLQGGAGGGAEGLAAALGQRCWVGAQARPARTPCSCLPRAPAAATIVVLSYSRCSSSCCAHCSVRPQVNASPHLVFEVLPPHKALHQAGLAAAHLAQQHQLGLHQLLNHAAHGGVAGRPLPLTPFEGAPAGRRARGGGVAGPCGTWARGAAGVSGAPCGNQGQAGGRRGTGASRDWALSLPRPSGGLAG